MSIMNGKLGCKIWTPHDGEDVYVRTLNYKAVWLNMEAVCSSEKLVSAYKTTRSHNPEEKHGPTLVMLVSERNYNPL
jgi:hypothetical protein